jgi:hypothetical protein
MAEEKTQKADWRCETVVVLEKDAVLPGYSKATPAGTVGKGTAITDYDYGRIAFAVPNATSLFLNLSKRHFDLAQSTAASFAPYPIVRSLPDAEAFQYLEDMMASIIFAYTALEAFANEVIPDDYIHTIAARKCSESYSKTQIERSLNLQVKLGEILPQILQVNSPKGRVIWGEFLKLEEIRNSLIHMKTADRQHIGNDNKSIWGQLMKSPTPCFYPTTKAMIDHFYASKKTTPHWYCNTPI